MEFKYPGTRTPMQSGDGKKTGVAEHLIFTGTIYIKVYDDYPVSMAKFLVCPNCGKIFKSPVMDLKFIGLGWTVPGLGVVKCPECGEKKSRKHYKVAAEGDIENLAPAAGVQKAAAPQAETDLIEDSKFEDE